MSEPRGDIDQLLIV